MRNVNADKPQKWHRTRRTFSNDSMEKLATIWRNSLAVTEDVKLVCFGYDNSVFPKFKLVTREAGRLIVKSPSFATQKTKMDALIES